MLYECYVSSRLRTVPISERTGGYGLENDFAREVMCHLSSAQHLCSAATRANDPDVFH